MHEHLPEQVWAAGGISSLFPRSSGSFPCALGLSPWSWGCWQTASFCFDETHKPEGPRQVSLASCFVQPETCPFWSWLDKVTWSHHHAVRGAPKCRAVSLAMEIWEEPWRFPSKVAWERLPWPANIRVKGLMPLSVNLFYHPFLASPVWPIPAGIGSPMSTGIPTYIKDVYVVKQ